jgi:tetratricopeptide (TPR) repeat protein
VENIRKDVRVVNLSLLQTDWYIRQLRDDPPRLPVDLDDRSIDIVGRGAFYDSSGNFVLTNRFMVNHLLEHNHWRRPAYFAVTVPDHMGWEPHFSLEGLVYRVNPDTLQPPVDMEATRKDVYEVFKYRGLFLPDGSWDPSVYKDENASTLTRNYAAAHIQLAFGYRQQGRMDLALAEVERLRRGFPTYTEALVPLGSLYIEAGDTAKAVSLYEELLARVPGDPEVYYALGEVLAMKGDTAGALERMRQAQRLNPGYVYAYFGAYRLLWQLGRRQEALAQLRALVELAPDDAALRNLLQTREREMGLTPSVTPVPPPPPPGGGVQP